MTAWNGLAVAALAEVGALLDRPDLVAAAEVAAGFVLDTHLVDGVLRRTSRGGLVGTAPAVLDDHADLAEGLLALHQATGDTRWADAATELLDQALERFADEDGTLHDTANDAPQLFARPAARTDGAEPCGASALGGALLTHAALTGSARHRDAAARAIDACGPVAQQDPRFAGWALAVAEAALAGPLQVAVVGEGPDAAALAAAARAGTSPGLVVVVGDAGRARRAAARRPPARAGRRGRLRVPGLRLRAADERPRGAACRGRRSRCRRDAADPPSGRRVRPAQGCREAQRMVTPGAVASSVATASRHPLSPGGR